MPVAYSSSKAHRITKRIAIAAALALVPTAFAAAPALAATTHTPAGVRAIDDDWGHGGWDHDHDGWGHRGWDHDHDGWGHRGWRHDHDGWGHDWR